MKFSKHEVAEYLSIVRDENPVHSQIVPGQFAVEMAMVHQNISWNNFKVKYVEPIEIDEEIDFEFDGCNHIIVSNSIKRVKIHILKN